MDKRTAFELMGMIEAYGNLRANVAAYTINYANHLKSDDPDKDIKAAEMLAKGIDANRESESVMSDIQFLVNTLTTKNLPPA